VVIVNAVGRIREAADRTLQRVPPLHRLAHNVGSPASRGKRLQAIWRTVSYDARTRILKRPTIAPIGERSKIIAYPGETNSPHAAYRNPPNPREMLVWRQHLKAGDLFIDVGANIGIYTIYALDLGAEVIACEPDPHNYQRVLEHLALNGYEADVLNVAVADKPGTLRLTQGLDSYNHLVDTDEEGIEVPAMTLDDIIGDRYVAGMKIDVEGAERLVIEGAKKVLSEQRIKLIQLEWADLEVAATLGGRNAVADLLSDAGYLFYRPDVNGRLHHLGGAIESSRRDVFASLAEPIS